MSTLAGARKSPVRRVLEVVLAPALLVLLVAWALLLRPTSLGGPAGYILVGGHSMEPTLAADTLALTLPRTDYEVGDIIAFRVPLPGPANAPLVIHRIVGGSSGEGFVTRGDNMPLDDPWRIRPDEIVGRQVAAVPGVAPLLLIVRSPLVLASLAAGVAMYVLLGWLTRPSGGTRPAAESPAEAGGCIAAPTR